jgi:hypothetical protein
VHPFLQWKSDSCYIFWVWDCSLRYPAWTGHAHCHPWPAQLYHVFSILSHKRHDFRTMLLGSICVFLLDFKLSPCSVFSVFSFEYFPGVWFILADVSEHSICSTFKADDLEFQIICLEDGTGRLFRNVGQYKPGAGKSPKRKHTECVFLFSL